jgi:hypothetical protein
MTMVGWAEKKGKVGILIYLTFLEKGVKIKMKNVIAYIDLVILAYIQKMDLTNR